MGRARPTLVTEAQGGWIEMRGDKNIGDLLSCPAWRLQHRQKEGRLSDVFRKGRPKTFRRRGGTPRCMIESSTLLAAYQLGATSAYHSVVVFFETETSEVAGGKTRQVRGCEEPSSQLKQAPAFCRITNRQGNIQRLPMMQDVTLGATQTS